MMLIGFLFLLLISDKINCEQICNYLDVLNYLNLSSTNELYSMTRPVKDFRNPTHVSLEVLLYAILDVVEKDQKFIPYVWTVTRWNNEFISWDPNQFCGIDNVSLPTDILWKPDLTIEEMTERDKAPPSPYLTINNKGDVEVQNDQVLVSTCMMQIYKFPFDIQKCNLTFKSIIHTAKEIRLQPSDNSSEATEWSREVMRTQYEWLFIEMTITTNNPSVLTDQDIIIYTITMKRRSVQYIVNFLLPVLFFLCLDLASFIISDSSGEKLSFKVTVLLAITVLQLILNEILPSSSSRVPLIAVYCIGIFALMMLSLLETIFVMHLREKTSSDMERDECIMKESIESKKESNDWTQGGFIYNVSSSEILSGGNDGSIQNRNSKLMGNCCTLERLSDELRSMEKTLTLLIGSKKKVEINNYWNRVATRVDKAFFLFYVIVVSLFLILIFLEWNSSELDMSS